MKKILILPLFFLLLVSCNKTEEAVLKEVFSFPIGYQINELGFFVNQMKTDNELVHFYYKNGFFYISDSINNKIMKLTENGESILTIYNPENYPNIQPTEKKPDNTVDQNVIYIKLYKPFPVYSPGLLAADINKNIYFVNRDPVLKKFHAERNSVTDETISKFNGNGEFLYYLGKEGQNGEPFGHIIRLITDDKDNLIVIELISSGVQVYQFSPNGKLLKTIPITTSQIPIIEEEKGLIIDLIKVVPGYQEDDIYLTCQFIQKEEATISLAKYDTLYEKIYRFSLNTERVEQLIMKVYPQSEDISKYDSSIMKELYGQRESITLPMESMIGIDENLKIYLSQKKIPLERIIENDELLIIYFNNGKLDKKREIHFPDILEYCSEPFLGHNGTIFNYYINMNKIYFIQYKY
ncbi:MAG: hypothetical protein MJB14_13545 [Spirochaetes bacterium]|nr:hypothetical protein [Spirochaetota bacterium]